MTRILLVDDDIMALEGIARNLDWPSLGIDAYHLAHSALQARQILDQEDIDILLSDIEMPKGSGLELVEWVNDNRQGVVCIFLISHANFSYANTALRLGGLDYLLKPAPYPELEKVIAKAVDRVGQLRLQRAETEQALFWVDNQPLMVERFWYDIARGTIPQEDRAIADQARRRHVDYTGAEVLPILFELSESAKDEWEPSLLAVAFLNILREVLSLEAVSPIMLHLEHNNYIALLPPQFQAAELHRVCTETLDICETLFSRPVKCCIGKPVLPQALYAQVNGLLDARYLGSHCPPDIVYIRSKKAPQLPPDIANWLEGLAQGNYEGVLSDIRADLGALHLERGQLTQLYQGFMWGIYPLMEQRGLAAHGMLAEEASMRLAGQAVQSVTGLLGWVEYIVQKLAESTIGGKDNTLVKIQKYINEHLADELNRTDIAAAVFLSPDHLSHLFKAKTGSSLMDYIIEQRMEKAKNCLPPQACPFTESPQK